MRGICSSVVAMLVLTATACSTAPAKHSDARPTGSSQLNAPDVLPTAASSPEPTTSATGSSDTVWLCRPATSQQGATGPCVTDVTVTDVMADGSVVVEPAA
jgi:hypothetical protein